MLRSRRLVTLAILSAGIAIVVGAVGLRVHASHAFFDPPALLSRFPAEDALVLSADFATLRRAGLLTESKAALEPDYKQFVDATGFDYRRDLDTLVASLSRSGTFFIAGGRFDWKKLRDYAAHHGGSCYQNLCRMQGSTPERHISFLPLRDDALALAVSTDDLAASRLTNTSARVTTSLPSSPVWFSVPGTILQQQGALPPSMHLMLSALTKADRVVVTLGPGGRGIEAVLDATCRTPDDAKILASQLRVTTGILKAALARDKTLSGDGFATMLTAGTFDQTERRVTGKWPVQRSLLDALTTGL